MARSRSTRRRRIPTRRSSCSIICSPPKPRRCGRNGAVSRRGSTLRAIRLASSNSLKTISRCAQRSTPPKTRNGRRPSTSSLKNSVAAPALHATLTRRRGGLDLSRLIPIACGIVVAWLVLLPLVALFYVAFSEDTPFGPGAWTLGNFVEAYRDLHIGRLFGNSFIYAFGSA